MTRAQKARQLAKRRAAQKRHRRIVVEDHGKNKIEVMKGPKLTPAFHKTDRYLIGEELRQAEQVISLCARVGFDPTERQVETMRALLREGKLSKEAIVFTTAMTSEMAQKVYETASQLYADFSTYGFNVVDASTGKRVDPSTLSNSSIIESSEATVPASSAPRTPRMHADEIELEGPSYHDHPTAEEWDDLFAQAKRRRRGDKGFIKVLTDAGFKLVGDDPKACESWVRA